VAGPRTASFRRLEAHPAASRLVAGSFTNATGTLTYKGYLPRIARRHPALFVMLHGAMQSADEFASITHMNEVADEYGALVLYPEQSTWAHPLMCWNWYDREHQFADGGEPALIAGATRQFCALHGVSLRHVYVAGMSAGGAMAVILGAVYPELFAAVGVHSGLPAGAASDWLSALHAMTSGPMTPRDDSGGLWAGERSAVRTIAFHGDRDTTVHPANGHAILDQACHSGPDLPPSGSLTSERFRTAGGGAVTRVTRSEDRGVSLAELWIIHGGDHVWSGGGEGASDSGPGPDASREMARFFLQH